MYEPPDIKLNFVDKDARKYCHACLSSDRTLSLLENYVDVYHQIINNSPSINMSQETLLCWECLAVLKKIKLFKQQVEKANKLLSSHSINLENSSLNSLSTLTTVFEDDVIFITHTDDTADLPIKEDLEKDEIKYNIKQEVDYEDYHNSEDVTQDDTELKEEITVTKRKPYIRKKQYRYVYNTNVRKKSLLRKKVLIRPDEVQCWIEREMSSVFYNNMTYKCKSCWYASNCRDKYRKHTVDSHRKSAGQYLCEICKSRFSTDEDLQSHISSHYYSYECAVCGLQSYSVRQINAHLDTHRTVQCIYCEAQFSELSHFREHYKSMHSCYICDFCGKKCSAKHILEKHMRHHAPIHPCPICHREYKTIIALRKHRSMKHAPARGEAAYCVLCDRQYDNVYVYRRHVQDCAAHAHERPGPKKRVPCPMCPNTYSRKAYMLNHYRLVHMNTSKHYCAECDKHFLNATKFKDHMRYTHEGAIKPKNKICSTCGRGFVSNRVLKNHILTHSGERPYECEVCGAKFTQKHSMVSHVKHIHMKSKRQPQPQWQQ